MIQLGLLLCIHKVLEHACNICVFLYNSRPDLHLNNYYTLYYKACMRWLSLYRAYLGLYIYGCYVSLTQVDNGYRMPPPQGCPNEVHHVMQRCWAHEPEERPNFAGVLGMLKALEGSVA